MNRSALPVLALVFSSLPAPASEPEAVLVEIFENIPDNRSWEFTLPADASETYSQRRFAFAGMPRKYDGDGVIVDRKSPFLVRARGALHLPGGEYRLLLRSLNAARVYVNEELVAQTRFTKRNADGHEPVPDLPQAAHPDLRGLPAGHAEHLVTLRITDGEQKIRLDAVVGGKKQRAEIGELALAIAGGDELFSLVTPGRPPGEAIRLDDDGWWHHEMESRRRIAKINAARRREARRKNDAYWTRRHEAARRRLASKHDADPPPGPDGFPVLNAIDRFIGRRLQAAGVKPSPLVNDASFLRRLSLDVRGVIPTHREVEAFLADKRPDRRARWIDRLLASDGWADHWVAYWQDVLAENPGILKPKLNNTGPFRWWIHETFLDNVAMDRFVTQLITMGGSKYAGGPAGFAMATQNDVPMAAKAHVLGTAFLGVQMKCARCHDAPYHPYKQKDLFSLAAMLRRGPQLVPKTSSVPRSKEEIEKLIVEVTLEPGSKVPPAWPFAKLAPDELPGHTLRNPEDTREQLAAIITSAENERFPRVIVNRLWKRYMGYGLVEPVDDWNASEPSHPRLLDYLAHELVRHDYDLKHVARQILNSHAYQRRATGSDAKTPEPDRRLFAGPARRRMEAEQLVDSLFAATGKPLGSEELNLDVDARRPVEAFLNLGTPSRAWEFASLSNERDRPALALPVAQSIIDVLKTFGWRETRQDPITTRDHSPNALQPLILANGIVGHRVTTLSDDSHLTELCLTRRRLPDLVRSVFVTLLSRPPLDEEMELFTQLLADGYEDRVREAKKHPMRRRRHAVSWSNHLSAEATRIKMEMERAAREGDPPTNRLEPEWRERMEDMVWALINSPEFIFVP